MSDHGNGASAGTDKAVWDDKAVSDMYFSIVEIRGGFSASEAAQVEQSMRARGYNFTAKQLQYVPLLYSRMLFSFAFTPQYN